MNRTNELPLPSKQPAEFDEFAETYDDVLNQALAVSGENKQFFAQGRIIWLKTLLAERGFSPKRVLDYGCGTGGTTPYFLDLLGASSVVGVDVSEESLKTARQTNRHEPSIQFLSFEDYAPAGEMDLAYCNGVFHHIRPPERRACADYVFRALRPGGIFAFWENNPWNPGTRYCMRVNPFDRDAIALSSSESDRLLRSVGFGVLARHYLFVFPRPLAWFRRFELYLRRLPLGAQYLLLCQRPQ